MLAALAVFALAPSATVMEPALIPAPSSLVRHAGSFALGPGTRIAATADAVGVARTLRAQLSAGTGLPLEVVDRAREGDVELRLDRGDATLGAEGYRLRVSPVGVRIEAATAAGLFYGGQTLRQLLRPDALRRAPVQREWAVPCVEIEDVPRFGWRGAMIDVARWFFPRETILKFIDLLALHKLNVLHLHLTDDQGWRVEIKRYPRLTEVGAWRKESMLGHYNDQRFDGTPHGGFYTQDDLREIVAYAAERFVTVVPEIEMPGHATAAIAAYPELGNRPDQKLEVATTWGVHRTVFNVEDGTIQFLKDVLDEVLEIFPSRFIHIGGDECPKDEWKASERAQARIRAEGLKDEHELQSWFVRQMDAHLDARGRRLIGWDEILEGGLAEGATVMSWRGMAGGIAAAKAGHDVVMAPTDSTYLDYYQADPKGEPVAIGGFLPLEKVYAFEPVPRELSPEEARHILGGQGQLWTEYISTPKHLEYMAFPRLSALSEALWSPKAARDFTGFRTRLGVHMERLSALDVGARALGGV